MGINNLVRTRGFRNFMAKLYGWGAAVVILGALFKINHYTGANLMLIIGLGTEAAIFFFSAFEPPHVEPDWSLVYPELAGMYHGLEVEEQQLRGRETQKLDHMLEEAKIGPELIDSLGEGLRNLSENTSNLADISNAGVATNEYVDNIKSASESAGELSESYKRTSESLNQDINASEEYFNNIKEAAQSASSLSNVYAQASESFKADVAVTDEFTESVKNAINSANMLSAKYTESADILSKSVESLDLDAVDGKSYNEQLSKISNNLASLNAVYELQLQSSNENVESTSRLHESIEQFMMKLNDSAENTEKFKESLGVLTEKVTALNTVYGNMLTAMSANTNV